MKKLTFLFTALFVFTSLSFAQNFATKGTIEAGGGIGFSSQTGVSDGKSASESSTYFSIYPYVGYFIIDCVELGLIPSFSTSSQGDNSTSSFGVYFAPAYNFNLKSNVFPFIEGKIGYNTSSSDDGNSATDDPTYSGLAWGFTGGVKVKIGNSALVKLAAYYDQITMNADGWSGGRNGENIFGVNAGFTIFFGR